MNALKIFTCSLILTGYFAFGQDPQTPPTPLSPKLENKIKGRPSLEIYGAKPINAAGDGWGFGFGLYSKPIIIEQIDKNQFVKLSIGSDVYFLQNVYRELGTLPLLAPQSGDARISMTQENYGVNVVARLMFDHSSKITPYMDVFTGLRAFSTNIRIEPLDPQAGYEESTSQNISELTHWNYGASVGLLYSLGKSAKINVGLMYTTSPLSGQLENVHTARIEGGSISAEKMNTPNNTVTLKFGLTFLLPKSAPACGCEGKANRNIGFWGGLFSGGGGGGLGNNVNINIGPSK